MKFKRKLKNECLPLNKMTKIEVATRVIGINLTAMFFFFLSIETKP